MTTPDTMTIASPTDIFFDQLKDLKSATEQVRDTLPQLANWATDAKLRGIFEDHRDATARHHGEIVEIFEAHSKEAGDDICKAIEGLIEGGNKHIGAAADLIVRDLLLIAHSNRIGHYLIAAADFTLAMASSCAFEPEADSISGILGAEREFAQQLAEVGESTFGIKLGGAA